MTSDNLSEAVDAYVKSIPAFYLSLDMNQHHTTYSDHELLHAAFCSQYPQFDGKILSLFGCRQVYPNRIFRDPVDECPDAIFNHVVCLCPGDYVVDFIYRHLDTHSEQPYHIQTLDDLKKNWFFIAPTRELFECFMFIDSSLLQETKAWYAKAYPDSSEEKWLAHLAKQQRQARECYQIVSTAFKNGVIFLPGTVEDNPHLKHLVEDWPKLFTI